MSTPAANVSAGISPQLIPSSLSVNFPSSTSTGATSSPSTGATPQLVPTVGSTNTSSNANTPIPGSTAPATPPSSPSSSPVSSVIPNATQAPLSAATTIAPVAANETVASQLNTDLASGSPYLDLAKSQSLQAASARGLQNSSIAAGAGEAAAIAAALPIAQQDASTALTTQQANLTALNTSAQEAQTVSEQTAAQLTTQAQQGQINYALQAQTEQANINQIYAQGIVNSGLSTQQSAEQIQQINQTSQNTIAQIGAQAAANASQDGPALQAQYLTGVTNIMTSTAAQIQQIYATSGLTPAQQQNAVATANAQMQQNINNLAAYYASSPLWDTGQSPAPIPGSTPAAAQTPGTAPPGVVTTPATPTPAKPATPAAAPAAPATSTPKLIGTPFGSPVYSE
jgi:hypothetical protein